MFEPSPLRQVFGYLGTCLVLLLVGCEKPSTPKSSGAGRFADQAVAVETADDPIVDKDYCFRIDSMGTRWKLLTEEEVVRILPDAVAGATSATGVQGLVIVEPISSDVDISAYTELVRQVYVDDADSVSPAREVKFRNMDARRFSQELTLNGLKCKYEKLTFLHQNFGYQLIAFGLKTKFSMERAEEFFNAFHLIEGTVTPRSSVLKVADFEGVGRRVLNGRFESASYKFGVEPPDGWQLMVGVSLYEADEEAEVGMTNPAEGVYLTITPEYIVDVDPVSHRQMSENEFATSMVESGAQQLESTEAKIGQEPISLHRFVSGSNLRFRFYVGYHYANDCRYQILAWHEDRKERDPVDAIAEAIQSIKFFDEQRAAQLASELRAKADPQNIIGPKYCLRNGVMRDFAHGVRWTKPQGFWRVSLGDEARAHNESCSMFVEEPESAIYLQWIVEDVGDFNAQTFHEAVAEMTLGEDHPALATKPQTVELSGATALVGEGEVDLDGLAITYRYATTIVQGRAHQLLAWGRPKNVQKNRAQFEAAINGFSFPGKALVETEQMLPIFRDNRAGLEVRLPGSGWTVLSNTQPQLNPIGAFLHFQRGKQNVQVMGLDLFEPGQDLSWAVDTVQQMLAANYGKVTTAKPTTSTASFGGIPWQVKKWQNKRMSIQMAIGVRQRTVYAIIVIADSGTGEIVMRQVTKHFKLLD